MKALITKGTDKGKIVDIVQWCNDWFSISNKGQAKIVSPTSLAFSRPDIKTIENHKNSGTLFSQFELANPLGHTNHSTCFPYVYSFKRRKAKK